MFTREEILSNELRDAALTRIDRMYRDGEIDGDRREEVSNIFNGIEDRLFRYSVSWAKQKNFTVCKSSTGLGLFCGVTKRWPKDKPNNKLAEMASFICAVTDLALHAPQQTEAVTNAA